MSQMLTFGRLKPPGHSVQKACLAVMVFIPLTLAMGQLRADDAVRLCSTELGRHQVEVVREFEGAPQVLADRHKVLQILVNLIGNARQALDSRPAGRRLVLRIEGGREGGGRVVVADNGAGIASENLTRIFSHGFTTKKAGHGFGLHSGANAAKEMGGSLTVQSDGPGAGARFTLELPGIRNALQDSPPPAVIVSESMRHTAA